MCEPWSCSGTNIAHEQWLFTLPGLFLGVFLCLGWKRDKKELLFELSELGDVVSIVVLYNGMLTFRCGFKP